MILIQNFVKKLKWGAKFFVQTVNILIQASVVQWQDFCLPSNIAVFESGLCNAESFLEKRKLKVLLFLLSTVKKEETTEILSWTQPQQLERNKFFMILFEVSKKNWIEVQNFVQTIKIV